MSETPDVGGGTEAAAGCVSAAGLGADRGLLGTITVIVGRFASLRTQERRVLRRESRLEKYRFQQVARQILPKERIRVCCKTPSPYSSPHLKYSPLRERASIAGLMVCGSPWCCPPCAARIAEGRRSEVGQAIAWAKSQGLVVVLSTFTLRHGATHSLEASLTALTGAYRRMQQRRDFKALRLAYGLSHTIKVVEATWSSDNGWHPHLHVLQCLSPGLNVSAYSAALAKGWLPSVASQGFSASARRGVDVRATWGDVEKYVTKLGRTWGAEDEITKANTKRGRGDSMSPMDLLRSVALTDDQAHANLFREFALTMKGTHQLQWSRGFKKLVGVEERSDADLAVLEEDQAAYWFAGFTVSDWRAIYFCGPEARADLEAAGDGLDRERVDQLLAEYRARYFSEGWGFRA